VTSQLKFFSFGLRFLEYKPAENPSDM